MHKFRILIVDDDRISRVSAAKMLESQGYTTEAVENAFVALNRLETQPWDVIVTDLMMPGMTGIELLQRVKTDYPESEVIVMSAYATVETAVEAMKAGAWDYLVKPFNLEELDFRIQKIRELKEARQEIASLKGMLDDSIGAHGIIGRSTAMQEIYERIELFADHDAPVLITGETGTGKELVSRALHRLSSRRSEPFIPIPCGSIPKELAESELFGHEKGSFTGAHKTRKGSFERGDMGTVLLDDIDDLPLDIQVKLLRVLQEGTLTRVGGTDEIHVDTRIIATSKVDLVTEVAEGRFRDDLFYRLRGLECSLPPLRVRGEDILLLSEHFLRGMSRKEASTPMALSPEVAKMLKAYSWPGNVRELRRAMESTFILCRGETIEPKHLPGFVTEGTDTHGNRNELFSLHLDGLESLDFGELVRQFERGLSLWALAKSRGHQKKAASILGLPRTTFQSKLGHLR